MQATQKNQTTVKSPVTRFERHEKKYWLDKHQYLSVLEGMQNYMKQDDYGLYTVCSLYCDNSRKAIARQAAEKPKYREKLRLRSYGVPTPQSTVFIELKKKYNGVSYKRRVSLPYFEAEQYLFSGIMPQTDSQIMREIDWFKTQHQLRPAVLLCYDRTAFFCPQSPALRITFDQNIRWRSSSLAPANGTGGHCLCGQGRYLMEVKTDGAIPLWLSALLSANGVYPVSFSKFMAACNLQAQPKECSLNAG